MPNLAHCVSSSLAGNARGVLPGNLGEGVRPSIGNTYPVSDQNGQNLYPISDQNGSKALPFGAKDTYTAYIRVYPPRGDVSRCPKFLFVTS